MGTERDIFRNKRQHCPLNGNRFRLHSSSLPHPDSGRCALQRRTWPISRSQRTRGSYVQVRYLLISLTQPSFAPALSPPRMIQEILADCLNFQSSLVFAQWDMIAMILCVFLLSYTYGEGKSNYFKGSILILAYLVVMAGFYISGYDIEETVGTTHVFQGRPLT